MMLGQRTAPTLLCAILSLLYASLPNHVFAQASASIVGQLRIAPGNEINSPMLVTLSSRGETVNSVYTDNEGRFGFSGLPGNLYHVVINEDGYLPVEEDVSVDPVTTSMKILTIFLVPREAKSKPAAPIKGGNTRLTGSSQYTQQVPKNARKQFDKGVRSDKDGKPDEAIRYYQKAIELAPEFYEARNNLGSDLLAKSRFPEAQQQFEQVVKVNPSDAAAYFNLGNLFLLTQQFDKGQQWVEQGLSKQPDSAFGHFLARVALRPEWQAYSGGGSVEKVPRTRSHHVQGPPGSGEPLFAATSKRRCCLRAQGLSESLPGRSFRSPGKTGPAETGRSPAPTPNHE